MMLFNKISKFCTPILALLVLVSSMSYTVDFHYCQGQLKSCSLFGKAKNCHEMASKMASCHHLEQESSESACCSKGDNNCCNNETVIFESDLNEQFLNLDHFELSSQLFAAAPKGFSSADFIGESKDIVRFAFYKPPLIQKDISVLFETFLL